MFPVMSPDGKILDVSFLFTAEYWRDPVHFAPIGVGLIVAYLVYRLKTWEEKKESEISNNEAE